ncbi:MULTISPECIES: biotin--[acetyl-CoA-carboxylase] ligase [Halomonadaceae]|jgi:BirA family biotin operon repressor/biotin-[acetyl-CoA-carboxylase] ligase|uniref:Bifunctional ligase/repressor BirA n=2 Tax=Vreelandella titanicae TaxID=664683 RepID=L9U8U7_9GAMM|nr:MULTISPECIES: biotin--[acetyl-CoA-carboxylase] ligase [Halomonas]NAO97818.1 biotin--[acetyl-CoA-carboxylase] ligase [Halomonas sp. MG34]QGQ69070.1 biotin--[acetyl-CoA-carboxylase] ligase [Halomonas sp. PA16-9]UEQ04442.1 biotin--[acetyl-CoA-carboxylase] ligase [Halomonas profundus]ELY20668.1 Biotin--acetyl-CoA-carboxylase ligase [Halomonas titanicae BH1]KIN13772.1 biotin--acetyl-CoA-carboxylase ligase [Halomonas sp. KHS3]|tara:strand:- start:41 stop:1036 length:996 start_codon:yes stop_codon:yes gene_type:complete
MTIGNLMRLLSDGEVHSGEQLGEALGISRAAVWKQLKKLEALGVEVVAVKGRGYQLSQRLEPLEGAKIVERLPAQARHHLARLFVEDQLPSSNEYLRQRFEQGAGHGEVCLVELQTAGRGRRGRVWSTPWGQSLMLSLGWRFESGIAVLEGLSLAVGVVVAQVLEQHGVAPKLKWPNDILLSEQGDGPGDELGKLAGILIEVTGDAAGPCEVVIGMGMNLWLPAAQRAAIDQPVAALFERLPDISRNQLASDVVSGLLAMLANFEQHGFAAWRDAWNQRHAYAGLPIRVIQGQQTSDAIAGEVDESGNLWVAENGHSRRLAGGEISVRRRL